MAATKCTKKEKERRVQELADLIVKGLSQRQLMVHVQETYGLSSQRSQAYIREARDVVRNDLVGIDRADMLAAKIQMLEQIASDAVQRAERTTQLGQSDS